EMNMLMKSETLEKLFKIQLVVQQPGAEPAPLSGHEPNGSYDDDEAALAEEAARLEAEEQLEALKPKQRQRLTFSGPESDPGPSGGATRAERRSIEKKNKKKLF